MTKPDVMRHDTTRRNKWFVVYDDGTVVHEDSVASFTQLDLNRVRFLSVNVQGQEYTRRVLEGQTPIFFRRNKITLTSVGQKHEILFTAIGVDDDVQYIGDAA